MLYRKNYQNDVILLLNIFLIIVNSKIFIYFTTDILKIFQIRILNQPPFTSSKYLYILYLFNQNVEKKNRLYLSINS